MRGYASYMRNASAASNVEKRIRKQEGERALPSRYPATGSSSSSLAVK